MSTTIVVIASGEMGAGIGGLLAGKGALVRTSLSGRGEASASRARKAGMKIVDDDRALLDGADFVLSIVPPAAAVGLAERLAPSLKALARRPLYIDCNALAPATKARVAERVTPTGTTFVDGGIVGPAPNAERGSPRLYVSGADAKATLSLRDFGLDMRLVEGGIGAAAALKLCYALFNKGTIALAATMILAARKSGVEADLLKELGSSQKTQLDFAKRQVPTMLPKAYRWVAEMEEIALFLDGNDAGSPIYEGAARLYERIARALESGGDEPKVLDAFVKRAP